MPEYPNLDEYKYNPELTPDYEPGKDHPEPELRERMKELMEECTRPSDRMSVKGYDLTFNEFRSANKKRCEDVFHPINSWKLHDWAIALIGEFGEAMNILKKIKRVEDGTDPLSDLNTLYPALMEEIADIVTYADLLLTSEGYTLAEEIIKKFNKVSDKRGSNIKL